VRVLRRKSKVCGGAVLRLSEPLSRSPLPAVAVLGRTLRVGNPSHSPRRPRPILAAEVDFLTLSRLKLLAIVAPLAFLIVLWTLAHTVFVSLHEFPWVLALLGVTTAVVALFAYGVFAIVNRLEERIVEQNRELEQRNEELGALLAVGRAASSSLERSELLDEAMAAILEFTRADAAEVWLAEGEGLPGAVAEVGVPVVHNLASDPRLVRESLKTVGFQSYCGLPLRHGGEMVGVLGVAALSRQQLAELAALHVAPAVIGHQPPRADSVLGVEGERSFEEADHGQ
jgi:hypothetical protein